MPIVSVQAALEVGVTFSLEEITVVASLGEVVHVIVLAVVADLFHHSADGRFVLPNQFGVFYLFPLEGFDEGFFSCVRALEFCDSGDFVD